MVMVLRFRQICPNAKILIILFNVCKESARSRVATSYSLSLNTRFATSADLIAMRDTKSFMASRIVPRGMPIIYKGHTRKVPVDTMLVEMRMNRWKAATATPGFNAVVASW